MACAEKPSDCAIASVVVESRPPLRRTTALAFLLVGVFSIGGRVLRLRVRLVSDLESVEFNRRLPLHHSPLRRGIRSQQVVSRSLPTLVGAGEEADGPVGAEH